MDRKRREGTGDVGNGLKSSLMRISKDSGPWMIACKRLAAWFGNLGRERMNFSRTPFNL